MSRASGRRQTTNRADALLRLRDAREFHEAGDEVRATRPKAAVSLYVQAGIAASDAICGLALGEYWRGDQHTGATALLSDVTPSGKDLARSLRVLLGIKDQAQYSSRAFGDGEVVRAERVSLALLTATESRAAR